jgi:hypothetical protein
MKQRQVQRPNRINAVSESDQRKSEKAEKIVCFYDSASGMDAQVLFGMLDVPKDASTASPAAC